MRRERRLPLLALVAAASIAAAACSERAELTRVSADIAMPEVTVTTGALPTTTTVLAAPAPARPAAPAGSASTKATAAPASPRGAVAAGRPTTTAPRPGPGPTEGWPPLDITVEDRTVRTLAAKGCWGPRYYDKRCGDDTMPTPEDEVPVIAVRRGDVAKLTFGLADHPDEIIVKAFLPGEDEYRRPCWCARGTQLSAASGQNPTYFVVSLDPDRYLLDVATRFDGPKGAGDPRHWVELHVSPGRG